MNHIRQLPLKKNKNDLRRSQDNIDQRMSDIKKRNTSRRNKMNNYSQIESQQVAADLLNNNDTYRLYSESETQTEQEDLDHMKSIEYGFEGNDELCKIIYHSDLYLKIGNPKQKIEGNRFDGGEEDIWTPTLVK